MANRRPLICADITGVQEITLNDSLITGIRTNQSRTIDNAGLLSAITLSTRYTFLGGLLAGVTLAVTLPAGDAAIDGLLMTVTSTVARVLVSWSSSGASTTGLPGSWAANESITIQYIHSQTRWFVC